MIAKELVGKKIARLQARRAFTRIVDRGRGYRNEARRLLAWLPVIWRANDYDYGSIVDVLRFQLGRLADHIEEHKMHTTWEEDAREIRKTLAHLNRFKDPPCPMPVGEEGQAFRFEGEENERGYRTLAAASPQSRRWAKRHRAMEERNWHAAWEMIRKHGQGWWC